MAYNPLSEAEKTFILHGVQDDFRNDGRSRRDFRPMEFQVIYIEFFGTCFQNKYQFCTFIIEDECDRKRKWQCQILYSKLRHSRGN